MQQATLTTGANLVSLISISDGRKRQQLTTETTKKIEGYLDLGGRILLLETLNKYYVGSGHFSV
jgi:hypothetical protein